MSVITVKNFETDAERVELPLGHMLTVVMPSGSVTKGVAEPGWKWSTHIKPLVGGDLCQAPHFGIITEGSMTAIQDGVETTYSAGDAIDMPPGHDAWVNGNVKCVMYEFSQNIMGTH
jgi:hypothetical protein